MLQKWQYTMGVHQTVNGPKALRGRVTQDCPKREWLAGWRIQNGRSGSKEPKLLSCARRSDLQCLGRFLAQYVVLMWALARLYGEAGAFQSCWGTEMTGERMRLLTNDLWGEATHPCAVVVMSSAPELF